MLGQERRKAMKNNALVMDLAHIVIGILVVVFGVITFLDPEGNMLLLPLIFLLAATLNFINGIHKFRNSGREKKKKISSVLLFIVGVLLVFLAVVSAVSIWR